MMIIDLKPLFSGRQPCIPLTCTLDLSDVEFGGGMPFPLPVQITGQVCLFAGRAELAARAGYTCRGECSRCLASFECERTLSFRRILSETPEDEGGAAGENSDIMPVPDGKLDLTALVTEELLLALPVKPLCRPDCRGLCLYCGRDLNGGLCGCRRDETDPRLAALKSLLDPEDPLI